MIGTGEELVLRIAYYRQKMSEGRDEGISIN
jgi:hypothetical protein